MRVYEVSEKQYYSTRTELKVDAGIRLKGKENEDWFVFDVYVLPHDKLILAKRYYCQNNWKYYFVKGEDGKIRAVKSVERPIIVREGEEFYKFISNLGNVIYVDVPFALNYSELYILPRGVRGWFREVALKELGEAVYYNGGHIPFKKFLEVLKQILTT